MQKDQVNILIIDDSVLLTKLYKNRLEKEGFKVSVFYYLEEAIEFIENKIPDLILLDMNLGLENGLNLLEYLKNNSLLNKIVVILMSTSNKKDSTIEKGLKLGAFDYFFKRDLSLDLIVEKIKTNIYKFTKDR